MISLHNGEGGWLAGCTPCVRGSGNNDEEEEEIGYGLALVIRQKPRARERRSLSRLRRADKINPFFVSYLLVAGNPRVRHLRSRICTWARERIKIIFNLLQRS